MRILHFSLGLPPFRTGGLTKYSVDLMLEQLTENEVFLLYPGKFTFSKKLSIKRNKSYNGICIYEIINPLPVPLLNGINQPSFFMQKVNKLVYVELLREIKPDVIHIHTLMGVHKEFLEASKELHIKIISTTHDYFGLCTSVNLMNRNGEDCEGFAGGKKCLECNIDALSIPMIKVMQSYPYRYFKNSHIVKILRTIKKNQAKKISELPSINESTPRENGELVEEYINLSKYYLEMFRLVDLFHFNSSIAKDQYGKYLHVRGEIIPISHSDISDKRQKKIFNSKPTGPLKITYLGPIEKYKGFNLLKDSLDQLLENGQGNWHLDVYGDFINNPETYKPEYYTFNGRYLYSELQDIFSTTDVLVIPSVWKETFGFIGLEALSHGVPTLVSDYVGYKDIIEDGKTGMIFKVDKSILTSKLDLLIKNRDILQNINTNILSMEFSFTMREHTKKIINLYHQVEAGAEI